MQSEILKSKDTRVIQYTNLEQFKIIKRINMMVTD